MTAAPLDGPRVLDPARSLPAGAGSLHFGRSGDAVGRVAGARPAPVGVGFVHFGRHSDAVGRVDRARPFPDALRFVRLGRYDDAVGHFAGPARSFPGGAGAVHFGWSGVLVARIGTELGPARSTGGEPARGRP